MRISSFRIQNYKSFRDSGEITLSTGCNLIVGQNNVGKTALLEAFGLNFPAKPHKSLVSMPKLTTPLNKQSKAEVTFSLSGEELRDILLTFSEIKIPLPKGYGTAEPAKQGLKLLERSILSYPEVCFSFGTQVDGNGNRKNYSPKFPSHNLYECGNESADKLFALCYVTPDMTGFNCQNSFISGGTGHDYGLLVCADLVGKIYSFRAERLNIGTCLFGYNTILAPDANNLPEVLNTLQSNNPLRFNRFNTLVRQIFPSIYQISVKPRPNNIVEIMVWTEDPGKEREDLAIQLSESGTGVGQVLAILYVVITSDFPRTIIIDEPNSFLHPAASRKLIEILKEFPQHQYIISTHSPEVITAADPSTLTLIRWEKPESVLEMLDVREIKNLQLCLAEVGAKLSDVFGADSILWVEGPTEEACFPLIIQRLKKLPVLGTSILAVKNTGDFNGRSKGLILDIYKKLSVGNALLPQAIAFLFDTEGLTTVEVNDINRQSNGLVHFLPRRTYENYLICPAAISAVLNTLMHFQEKPVSEEQVADWLKANGGKKKYTLQESDEDAIDITNETWLSKVHGAKLLDAIFCELSNGTDVFRKTTHSVLLTEWLLEHRPEVFVDLADLLKALLKPGDSTGALSIS